MQSKKEPLSHHSGRNTFWKHSSKVYVTHQIARYVTTELDNFLPFFKSNETNPSKVCGRCRCQCHDLSVHPIWELSTNKIEQKLRNSMTQLFWEVTSGWCSSKFHKKQYRISSFIFITSEGTQNIVALYRKKYFIPIINILKTRWKQRCWSLTKKI